jgi:hypothetical protein
VTKKILTIAGISTLVSLVFTAVGFFVTRNSSVQAVFRDDTDVVLAASGVLVLGVLLTLWGLELCFSVMGAFEEDNVLRGAVLTLVGLGLATVGVLGLVDLFTS